MRPFFPIRWAALFAFWGGDLVLAQAAANEEKHDRAIPVQGASAEERPLRGGGATVAGLSCGAAKAS